MTSVGALDYLHHLWKKGTSFLGTRYALLGGAMTWVSDRHLVSAISNAGGFGILACGSMNPDQLQTEIQETRKLTSHPFGVNLITLHPQLPTLTEVCLQEKVSHVVFAGGLPPTFLIPLLHHNNTKIIGFAPSLIIARKLERLQIDALIIEGLEAGGHVGPISTSVLAQEILPYMPTLPIFVAGGIGRGETILAYLEMGAAGCQLGTRFVCATESRAHPHFKEAFIRAQARDAVLSQQIDSRFPVIPVRALTNKGTQRFLETQQHMIQRVDQGLMNPKEAQLEIEHFWAGSLRRAVVEGDIENGSLMAGQSVGMVNQIEPTQDIIHNLLKEIEVSLRKREKIGT